MGVNQSSSIESYTVVGRMQHFAETIPDQELFVFCSGKTRDAYTAKQLLEVAGKFANRLRHQYGFKRYDVIANTLPNSPERLITDLGITLAGCVAMNGQILLADGDDFYQSAKNSRSRGVILSPDGNTSAWRLLKPHFIGDCCSNMIQLSCDRAPELITAIMASRHAEGKPLVEDLRASNEDIFIEQSVAPDDLLVIFTTSGSTGYSKLVPHTHTNIFLMWDAVSRSVHADFDTSYDEVIYDDRALGWSGGYPYGTYLNGDKRVLMDAFEAHGLRSLADMWQIICQERCTVVCALPLDIDNIIKHVDSLGKIENNVKILATGGQPLRKPQLKKMFTTADGVLIIYGSTESCYLTQANLKGVEDYTDFLCGKTNRVSHIRIVNDKGEDCKPRQVGSLLSKGSCVFKGYFNQLENPDPKTAAAFTEDGWHRTEDNGFFDEDGNIYVICREKDIIIYGGAILYPAWLEAKIMTHSDVSEAWVVPVTDPVLFHNICACVKSAPGSELTENKLRAYCADIFLTDTEDEGTPMPKYFLIMENFPKIPTGKTDKVALRKMAEKKFGLKENDQ